MEELQEWTRLPTVGDVRRRIRDRLGDVSAVADDVLRVWNASGCRVHRDRVAAAVDSLRTEGSRGAPKGAGRRTGALPRRPSDDEQLLDLVSGDSPSTRSVDFNEVFYADQVRDRCMEVIEAGRAFVVGGKILEKEAEDLKNANCSHSEKRLRAQLRLALAHIDFLREKVGPEGRTVSALRARQARALRLIADILRLVEEAQAETEIDLGKLLNAVKEELRDEGEERRGKKKKKMIRRDILPVTKLARKSNAATGSLNNPAMN